MVSLGALGYCDESGCYPDGTDIYNVPLSSGGAISPPAYSGPSIYSGGSVPGGSSTGNSNLLSWLESLGTTAAKTTSQVLLNQNRPSGVYTQTGPNGTVTYYQPTGNTGNIFSASNTGVGISGSASSNLSSGLIFGGVALVAALVLISSMGRK